MDAPYYNGDPDDGYRSPSTGQRTEEPAASDYRGLPCQTCGQPMHRVYTLADVGCFCSPGCRQKAAEPGARQGVA